MITSLYLQYDLGDSNIGYVIGDHLDVLPGSMIPLYIPKLMSSIEQPDDIKTNTIAIESPSYIFCNSKENMPNIKNRLKVQNYILAKAGNGDYPNGLKNGEKVFVVFANDSLREIYFYDAIREKEIRENKDKPYVLDEGIILDGKADYDKK